MPTERSPFKAILGPNSTVDNDTLLHGYIEFYSSLFFDLDGNIAYEKAKQIFNLKGVNLLLVSSRVLFIEAYKYFEKEHSKKWPKETQQDKEKYFNKLRDYYFMFDLYPEDNKGLLTYENILVTLD